MRVEGLLEAAPGIKYRTVLGIAYGAGSRVTEVAHLKADDIDSKRMLIRFEEARAATAVTRCCRRSCLNCLGSDGARTSGAAWCCARLAGSVAVLRRSDLDPAAPPSSL